MTFKTTVTIYVTGLLQIEKLFPVLKYYTLNFKFRTLNISLQTKQQTLNITIMNPIFG